MIVVRAILVAVGLVVLWQVVILLFQPPSYMLPTPWQVLNALSTRSDLWQVHGPATLTATLVGFAAGSLLGMALALLMSFVPVTRPMLMPVMVVSQAMPVFAIAPLLILWFGFGVASKIVITTIVIFFPVASAYADGLQRPDPGLLDIARLYRARRWQVVTLIRMPAAVPALVTGLRVAVVYAPIGAVIGEWLGASSGLGYVMVFANSRSQTAVMFAALLMVITLAVILRALVDLATQRLVPWAPESQSVSNRRE